MLSFLENGHLFYVAAVICLLGLVGKWLVSRKYARLMKQSAALGNAKDNQLKQLKGRYENTWRINEGVSNSELFVEKALTEYRFLWTTLENFGKIGRQSGIILLFLGGAAAFVGEHSGLSTPMVWRQLYICLGFSLVLFLWDCFLDTEKKHRTLVLILKEYFENVLESRLRQGVVELSPDMKPEKEFDPPEGSLLKGSLAQAAVAQDMEQAGKEWRTFSRDEERLIKEIIREYLV